MSSLTTLQSNGTSSKKPENKSPAPYKSSAQKLSPVANKPASQVKPANQGKQNKEKPEVKVNSEDKSKNQKKTPPAGKINIILYHFCCHLCIYSNLFLIVK